MSGLLTPAERDRFASYLEQEAATDKAMARQLKEISGPEALITKLNVESMAARVIAQKLRSIMDETL